MAKILLIEDDASIRTIIQFELTSKEHEVNVLEDGRDATDLILTNQFDLVVVDWMLPYKEGIDIIKEVRGQGYIKPILLLTAKSQEEDIVCGLEAGADDYLTKPFLPSVLMARISAHLRRLHNHFESKLSYQDIILDAKKREVFVGTQNIVLTKVEYDLLLLFLKQPEEPLSRQELLEKIWNFSYDGDTRLVDIHVFKLKGKLVGSKGTFKSVRGVGYKLVTKDE